MNKPDYENNEIIGIMNIANLCNIEIDKPTKNGFMAKCPFCDDKSHHLRLTIKSEDGKYYDTFKCYRCGESGSALTMYARLKGLGNAKEAYHQLMNGSRNRKNVYKTRKIVEEKQKELKPAANRNTNMEYINSVYTSLLNKLTLSSYHYNNLIERGLTEENIKRNKYRSLPDSWKRKAEICNELISEGYRLKGIPGFYQFDNGSWCFVGKGGFLIPIRDYYNRINALQIRYDNVKQGDKKKRYVYFGSTNYMNGCQAIASINCSLNSNTVISKDVIVTEGPLKGDIAHQFTGKDVLAVPGVNAIQDTLVSYLKRLKKNNVTIAFDMDLYNNPHVKKSLISLQQLLLKEEMNMQLKTWKKVYMQDKAIKGIDDYCLYISKR